MARRRSWRRPVAAVLTGAVLAVGLVAIPAPAQAEVVEAECLMNEINLRVDHGEVSGSYSGTCTSLLLPGVERAECQVLSGTGSATLLTAQITTTDSCRLFGPSGPPLATITVTDMTRLFVGPEGLVTDTAVSTNVVGEPFTGDNAAGAGTLRREDAPDLNSPPDPEVFAFFKGLNDPADGTGELTALVEKGL